MSVIVKKIKGVKAWGDNWSARGIVMMDRMERFTPSSFNTHIEGGPSHKIKLNILLQKFPKNEFYQSLKSWIVKKRRLSKKQVQAIDRNYQRFINH